MEKRELILEGGDVAFSAKGAIGSVWTYALGAAVITMMNLLFLFSFYQKETWYFLLFFLPFDAIAVVFYIKVIKAVLNFNRTLLAVTQDAVIVRSKGKYYALKRGHITNVREANLGYSVGSGDDDPGRYVKADSAVLTFECGQRKFSAAVRNSAKAMYMIDVFRSGGDVFGAAENYKGPLPKALSALSAVFKIAFPVAVCLMFMLPLGCFVSDAVKFSGQLVTAGETGLAVKGDYPFKIDYADMVSVDYMPADHLNDLKFTSTRQDIFVMGKGNITAAGGKTPVMVFYYDKTLASGVCIKAADGTYYVIKMHNDSETEALYASIRSKVDPKIAGGAAQ